MWLYLNSSHRYSRGVLSVSVKRGPEIRRRWLDYYGEGKRICFVKFVDQTCFTIMRGAPRVSGATITFLLDPIVINDVFGGRDGRLSTVFVSFSEGIFHGQAINGWKFQEYDGYIRLGSHQPSTDAEDIALNFISKHCNIDIKTIPLNERQIDTNRTSIADPGPSERAVESSGTAPQPGIRPEI